MDSSGFSLKTSSKWFDIRIKRKSTKKDYIKLHIVIDVETGIILHFTITDWKGSDPKEFKRLIRDLPRLGKAAGDKAYSSRANCQAVADKKGKPFLCWSPEIKGIKGWLKRRELAIKVLAYNTKRVLYIERAEQLGIPLWVSCQ